MSPRVAGRLNSCFAPRISSFTRRVAFNPSGFDGVDHSGRMNRIFTGRSDAREEKTAGIVLLLQLRFC